MDELLKGLTGGGQGARGQGARGQGQAGQGGDHGDLPEHARRLAARLGRLGVPFRRPRVGHAHTRAISSFYAANGQRRLAP
jgi:hypothetical protein